MGAILRKYGVQTTILFPLIDAGAQDFEATPVVHASGDTQISKDEGAFADTTNGFTHIGNGSYALVLSATEMQAARVVVTVKDQGTKAWEDQEVLIETYGNASAQHPFDLGTALTPTTIWAYVVENSKTAAQIFRGMWALLRGKTSGLTAGVGTVAYRDDADSKDRITGTVDADGNRTGVTIADLD